MTTPPLVFADHIGLSTATFAAPLRAVDNVSVKRANGTMRISARKAVTGTDPYLSGHFPGFIIFPGVFLIEALRQAVAIALGQAGYMRTDIIALRSVRFLAPLMPGDVFTIDAEITDFGDDGRCKVDAHFQRADGTTVARLKVEFQDGE